MKKILYLFIAFALLITGCGTKEEKEVEKDSRTPKQVVLDANSKMDTLDSYRVKMKMEMVFGDEDFNFTYVIETTGDYDDKNKTAKEVTITKMGEEETEEISYKTYNDNKTTTYTKGEDDKWYKSTEDDISDLEFINKLTDATEVSSETSNRKFKLLLPKEAIMELFGDDFEENEIQFNIEDAELYIYVSKDDYITKMILKMPMSVSFEGISMLTNTTVEMIVSDLNTVGNVVIPKDILDNALETED